MKGRAHITIQSSSVLAQEGTAPIDARFVATSPATKIDDAVKVAVPTVGGAVLGAVLRGKKGAAIGAGVGGGAGTAAVLMTPGKEIVLGRGATVSVQLTRPVDVKIPL